MDSRTYFWMGYAIIAVVVFLTLFSVMNKLTDNSSLQQRYLSKDISLVEQTVFASPYNLNVKYFIGEKYEVIFEKPCSVLVNLKGTPLNSGNIAHCMFDSYLTIVYPELAVSSDFLFLIKEGTSFEVKLDG